MRRIAQWLAVLFLILFFSCQWGKRETVVARVGDAELTLEEAKAALDTTRGVTNEQLLAYISRWVDEELLYQEARRRGIESSDEFTGRLNQTRRQFANQMLLEEEFHRDSSALDEEEIRAYYEQHTEEFFLREDIIKLNRVCFERRDQASIFAAAVARDIPWQRALEDIAANPSEAGIVSGAVEELQTQRTLYPPELWKVVRATTQGDVSFPVKTEQGYVILQPLSLFPRGQVAAYEVVRDEVRRRTIIERRRTVYSDLLGTLRRGSSVEIVLSGETRHDTTKANNHE